MKASELLKTFNFNKKAEEKKSLSEKVQILEAIVEKQWNVIQQHQTMIKFLLQVGNRLRFITQ